MIDPLPAERAIEYIRACRLRNEVVLGVEGFQKVAEGYMPLMDLILDMGIERLSAAEAATAAEAFVGAHAAEGVLFEITA